MNSFNKTISKMMRNKAKEMKITYKECNLSTYKTKERKRRRKTKRRKTRNKKHLNRYRFRNKQTHNKMGNKK
jgi:hypothetical protein